MAKSITSGKKNSIIKLKFFVEKLKRSLLLGRKSHSDFGDDSTYVPQDVKEGHFAVVAADGGEMKRFVVALSYLMHPIFLELLEQAAEEYGFDREGALTIPCPPSELQKILDDKQWKQEEEESPHVLLELTGRCSYEAQMYNKINELLDHIFHISCMDVFYV